MGIQSLLPFLANSTRDAHISEFENEFVAIDAYCWLHRGIYACAYEVAMKKPTTKYVDYCMRYIEMLEHFKVKPILVFDGRQLSSKSETEKKRREERKKKYEKGKELIRAGKTYEGRKLLGESVDVSHELALNLMKKCREKNIDCIVAPYEADSQLAFLSLRNIVKCIITEDSDLLAYGCERVMFKMNTSGKGRLIEKSSIHISLNMTPEEFNEDIFRYMCILSGCDYLPSLPSIGPATALKFIKLLKDSDIYDALPRLPIYLKKMNVKVTPEYIEGFRVADNTFKYQLVYDPFLRSQVPVRPTDNDDDIVGAKLPDDLAFQLAVGNVDPISMKILSDFDPDKFGRGFTLLWRTDFLPNAKPKLTPFGSFHEVIEGRKRQRENLESDSVQSFTNDLKKPRTPVYFTNSPNVPAKKPIQKVPQSGFVFELKVQDDTKQVSKPKSELLNSRYFSGNKVKKKENNKKQVENINDRQKGESYEDYLHRLYNECFPAGETENEPLKEHRCCEEQLEDMTQVCSSCKKCRKCCTCATESDQMTDTQKLGECIRQIEEHKKSKQNSTEHFLLDEIYKSQSELSGDENVGTQKTKEEKSPSESLSSHFKKFLSKLDSRESPPAEKSRIELPEKENSEVIYAGEHKSVRSPSPVFKVQKDGRVLSRNCNLGNISDTAATPTSVYFSSVESESLKESNLKPSMRTPTTFQRTMPSVRSFNSVPSKVVRSNVKSSSASRTLFQFGFKKERRSEA